MNDRKQRISSAWKNRKKIVEGILNNIFTTETVDAISEERLAECVKCENYDVSGKSCVMPGTGPCCELCGCSLKLATKSLSYTCMKGNWPVYISEEENVELSLILKYKTDLDALKADNKVEEKEYKELLIQISSVNTNEAGYARMRVRQLMSQG